ncbi:MAG: phenylalanine--tRNA ligase subunit beta [Burkholderiaceae bacterium]|jgi:phenylalanyl-tRNA synthetase beta chain|nr:phenylalanine--tRNA ligase subunit beta [Burkholderiaceae bacterium]
MQFSEKWLRTMADPAVSTDNLADLLTMAGLEVEDARPVAPPFSDVVVARVLKVEKHPNADRLTVCQVDAGGGEPLSIVCGAPNVRDGMLTACARVGAVLPTGAGEAPFLIRESKLRGVESFGMLCSEKELQLSGDHAGLMDLPQSAEVGRDIRDYLNLDDRVFTIKLTPNRADCLSVLGVAREVSALTGVALQSPFVDAVPATAKEKQPVRIVADDLCGRFTGRTIRGINARAETPEWMRERLIRGGQRPISALVDISNYVMLELGQPTHIYDLRKIRGELVVRWGQSGEQVSLLTGETREVDSDVGVIADNDGAESLAGIMGGARSAVSADTEDIFIEAAFWFPEAIQGRSRRFHFTTDAAHRFERGVDFEGTVRAVERITGLVAAICGIDGKTVIGEINDQVRGLPARLPVRVRTARASRVIGIPFADEAIADIFRRLGFAFDAQPGVLTVTPPSYRFDIVIEEDLIEEIARVYGYDNIPALFPVAPHTMRAMPEDRRPVHDIRRQIAGRGYQEVTNYSFVSDEWERDFADNNSPIRLLNPIASQMCVMRSSLIGSLVSNVRHNLNRQVTRIRLFEVAAVYLCDAQISDSATTIAGYSQPRRLGGIAYGTVLEEQWGGEERNADFFDVKADVETLFPPGALRFVAAEHPALHPGRCARIWCDGVPAGILGELHPALQQKYALPLAPLVFELDISALERVRVPVYRDIPRFPAVIRDMAVIVPESVTVQELLDVFVAERQNTPQCAIMQRVVLFDDYRGSALSARERSLAFRFTLQDIQGTLQDKEVEAAMAALFAAVGKKLGARLRA